MARMTCPVAEWASVVDPATFDRLVRTHRRELLVHFYQMLGSVLDAEDIVQETFLRALRSRTGYQHEASVRTWLYRMARR